MNAIEEHEEYTSYVRTLGFLLACLASYPTEKLEGLAILTAIVGVIVLAYLLAWRSSRSVLRKVGAWFIAALAALAGLFGIWWTIGALSPFPPPDGNLWGAVIALPLLLALPLGSLYISARFVRRALGDDSKNQKSFSS